MKYLAINENENIKKALRFITKNGFKCVLVINKKEEFLGTLSDGDIRNALISNHNITEKIKFFYNKKSKFVYENNINNNYVRELLIKFSYSIIPVIDKKRKIKNVITWSNFFDQKDKKKNLNVPVVIMAGGRGVRLKPFTNILPKPLIPINEQTILDIIIKDLKSYGLYKIFLTINYKSEIIKSYLKEMNYGHQIKCINEKEPLGTAGSLRLIPEKINKDTFVVTNCDILTKINYEDLIKYHHKNKNSLTLVTSIKKHVLPYGVYKKDKKGKFLEIIEKPSHKYNVNIGIYVLERECIKLIPKNKKFDMTDLIKIMKRKKFKIGNFNINEKNWQDVGNWNEFSKLKIS